MRYKGLALKAWGRRVLVKALAEKFTCLKKTSVKKKKRALSSVTLAQKRWIYIFRFQNITFTESHLNFYVKSTDI